MNVAFWFMLAWGVFGLLRTPKRERSGILFRTAIAALCMALTCAAILHFA